MQTFILSVKHNFGTKKFFILASDQETAKQMLMKAENCPAIAIVKIEVLTEKKYIQNIFGRYYKAAKTEKYIYYVNYKEGDDTAAVLMFTRDMQLVSNNYFASVGLLEDIEEDQIIWASRTMKPEVKKMKQLFLND